MIIILDAYNVIHRVPEFKKSLGISLERGRQVLVSFCKEWLSVRRDVEQFWLVFDGQGHPGGEGGQGGRGIRIMYSAGGETADDRILHLMEEVGRYDSFVVVSDDAAVARGARVRNAQIMSVASFHATLRSGKRRKGSRSAGHPEKDLSPKESRAITESLKREWGIED